MIYNRSTSESDCDCLPRKLGNNYIQPQANEQGIEMKKDWRSTAREVISTTGDIFFKERPDGGYKQLSAALRTAYPPSVKRTRYRNKIWREELNTYFRHISEKIEAEEAVIDVQLSLFGDTE
jgi:hypothetical protein